MEERFRGGVLPGHFQCERDDGEPGEVGDDGHEFDGADVDFEGFELHGRVELEAGGEAGWGRWGGEVGGAAEARVSQSCGFSLFGVGGFGVVCLLARIHNAGDTVVCR